MQGKYSFLSNLKQKDYGLLKHPRKAVAAREARRGGAS